MQTIEVLGHAYGEELGLYSIPDDVSESEFSKEFNSFEYQDDFDDNNKIGAIRIFIDNYYNI